MSIPRSNSRSSTLRKLSGNRTYIMTTKRITSGDELKHRNGLSGFALDLRFVPARYQHPWALPHWSDGASERALEKQNGLGGSVAPIARRRPRSDPAQTGHLANAVSP